MLDIGRGIQHSILHILLITVRHKADVAASSVVLTDAEQISH